MPEPVLAIGGLQPLTTIDFPGRLAAVVFCQGCPWRCAWCSNAHLQPGTPGAGEGISWEAFKSFLVARKGLLDGIVFCGGEPLIQPGLADALQIVREMGYETALHTGGALPDRLKAVLPLVDWVGFDIKAPFKRYAEVTGVQGSGDAAQKSLKILLASGVAYEVRTTADPVILSAEDVRVLAKEIAAFGVNHFVLQECLPTDTWKPGAASALFEDKALLSDLGKLFPVFETRRAEVFAPSSTHAGLGRT